MVVPNISLVQILRWNRRCGRLAVPENLDDVVAVAALEQLDAVDAAGEGQGVFGAVA